MHGLKRLIPHRGTARHLTRFWSSFITDASVSHGLSFNALPTELLRLILKHMRSRKDIWSLSLTCWRFYTITREFLYAEYHFSHSYQSWNEGAYGCEDPNLLLRSLLDNPDLFMHVKTVKIGLSKTPHLGNMSKLASIAGSRAKVIEKHLSRLVSMMQVKTSRVEKRVAGRICHSPAASRYIHMTQPRPEMRPRTLEDNLVWLLLLLPQVKTLSVELPDRKAYTDGYKLLELIRAAKKPRSKLAFHGFRYLRRLSIRFGNGSKAGPRIRLSSILQISTLRNVTLKYPNLYNSEMLKECPRRSSRINRLDVIKPFIKTKSWNDFLGSFERLVSLHVEFRKAPGNSAWAAAYRLDRFIADLRMHRNSLTWLDLRGALRIAIHNQYPRPSLRSFWKLKGLRIPSGAMWMNERMCQGESPPLIWEALKTFIPTTLHELQIHYTHRRIHGSIKYPMVDQLPTNEQWKSFISRESFPKLRRVLLYRQDFIDGTHYEWKVGPGVSWSRDGPLDSVL